MRAARPCDLSAHCGDAQHDILTLPGAARESDESARTHIARLCLCARFAARGATVCRSSNFAINLIQCRRQTRTHYMYTKRAKLMLPPGGSVQAFLVDHVALRSRWSSLIRFIRYIYAYKVAIWAVFVALFVVYTRLKSSDDIYALGLRRTKPCLIEINIRLYIVGLCLYLRECLHVATEHTINI